MAAPAPKSEPVFAFSAGVKPADILSQPLNAFTASTASTPSTAYTTSISTASAFSIVDNPPPTLKLTRSLSHQGMAYTSAEKYMPLCEEGDTILINYYISWGGATYCYLTRVGDQFHERLVDDESVYEALKKTFTFSSCFEDFHADLKDEIKQQRTYMAYLKAKELSTEPLAPSTKDEFDGYLAGKTKCFCPIKLKEE